MLLQCQVILFPVKTIPAQDGSALEGKVTLVHIARGSVVCKQGDVEKFLTFVVSGHLEVSQHDVHDEKSVSFTA